MPEQIKTVQVSTEREDELMDASFKAAYKVAYKLLGHREASQDVAIEAVSRLIEKKYQTQDFAPGYAAKIASRLVISSWRKNAVSRKYAALVSQSEISPDKAEQASALRVDLRKAIQKLSERQREIIVLRFLADFPEQAVADFLNISIGTVKSTTSDALSRLKTMVEVTP